MARRSLIQRVIPYACFAAQFLIIRPDWRKRLDSLPTLQHLPVLPVLILLLLILLVLLLLLLLPLLLLSLLLEGNARAIMTCKICAVIDVIRRRDPPEGKPSPLPQQQDQEKMLKWDCVSHVSF